MALLNPKISHLQRQVAILRVTVALLCAELTLCCLVETLLTSYSLFFQMEKDHDLSGGFKVPE